MTRLNRVFRLVILLVIGIGVGAKPMLGFQYESQPELVSKRPCIKPPKPPKGGAGGYSFNYKHNWLAANFNQTGLIEISRIDLHKPYIANLDDCDISTTDLLNAAQQSFKAGQNITKAGRAVTKHPEYFGFKSTQELRQTYRSDAQLNSLGAQSVKLLLQDGVKSTGAGGRYPNGWITYTLPDGRAASWTKEGEFIGFRGVK